MKIIFQSFNIKYSDFQKFITFRRNKNPVSAKAGTTKNTLLSEVGTKKRPRKQTASEVCLSGLILLLLIAICMLPTR